MQWFRGGRASWWPCRWSGQQGLDMVFRGAACAGSLAGVGGRFPGESHANDVMERVSGTFAQCTLGD